MGEPGPAPLSDGSEAAGHSAKPTANRSSLFPKRDECKKALQAGAVRRSLQESWHMAHRTGSKLKFDRSRIHKVVLLLALAALLDPDRSCWAQLYKWTDGGKTHYSDRPPSHGHQDLRIIQITPAPPPVATPPRSDTQPSNRDSPAGSQDPTPPPPLGSPPSAHPAQAKPVVRSADSSCEAAWKQYMESQACFMPYRRANGSLREEAWTVCNDVPDPNPRCGPAPTLDTTTAR